MLRVHQFFLAVLLPVLAACASFDPRTPQSDSAFKRVLVVSLLDSEIEVYRVGLTVFNNDSRRFVAKTDFNRLAVEQISARLREVRPAMEVTTSVLDPTLIAMRSRNKHGTHLPFDPDQFRADLKELVKSSKADALIVVGAMHYDAVPVRGLGVLMRTLSVTSASTATLVCGIVISLRDRDLNNISGRVSGNAYRSDVPAIDLGLTYELDPVASVNTQEGIERHLESQLTRAISSALTFLGY